MSGTTATQEPTLENAEIKNDAIENASHLRPLPKSFNIHEAMIPLRQKDGKNKNYLPVQWRLVWFREVCKAGTIDTEELEYDLDRVIDVETYAWNPEKGKSEKVTKGRPGYARYKAVISDGMGGRATGTKDESKSSFDDFGPKAETGAIGRALAGLGFGTQFAIDLDEGDRIVDSPTDLSPTSSGNKRGKPTREPNNTEDARQQVNGPQGEQKENHGTDTASTTAPAMIIDAQKTSLRSLYGNLEKAKDAPEEPDYDGLTYEQAKTLITTWSTQWRTLKAASNTNRAQLTKKEERK